MNTTDNAENTAAQNAEIVRHFEDCYAYRFNERRTDGVRMRANDNVPMDAYDRSYMEQEVTQAVTALMKALQIDIANDHNTVGTPARVAKMFVREVMRGRYEPMPDITAFPNDLRLDELYVTGPISVRSMCSHHLVPIIGHAWIGVVPDKDTVIGLSKFNRLVDWVFARPQIQEEASIQLADIIEQVAKPRGLAVLVKATHMCMTWRGVRESMDATMTTSVMRGVMRDKPEARAEFLSLVSGGK